MLLVIDFNLQQKLFLTAAAEVELDDGSESVAPVGLDAYI